MTSQPPPRVDAPSPPTPAPPQPTVDTDPAAQLRQLAAQYRAEATSLLDAAAQLRRSRAVGSAKLEQQARDWAADWYALARLADWAGQRPRVPQDLPRFVGRLARLVGQR